jgi:integrase
VVCCGLQSKVYEVRDRYLACVARWGELATVQNICLAVTICINRGDVLLTRKSITLSLTKAGRTRPVPLNSIALDAFKSLKASGAASGPVFLYADGNPVHTPRGWFETAIEKAEIKDYTWHCNRRTFASRLVLEGVDIRTVAQLMGHSTIQMTMRYSHLAPEHSQTAVERLVPSGQLVTKSVTTRKRQKAVRQ